MDMLKVKSYMIGNGVHAPIQPQQKNSNGKRLETIEEQPQQIYSNGSIVPIQEQQQEQQARNNSKELSLIFEEHENQPSNNSTSGVVVTTKWETFDSMPPLITLPSTSTNHSMTNNNSTPPKFNWEFFD